MNREYDFLFVFEVKQREFENLCLLKYELSRRGYSVKILPQSTWYYSTNRIPTYNCKVLVLPWCYSTEHLIHGLRFANKIQKVVNMQWEQVWESADEENPNFIGFLKGLARECTHVSWGPANGDKLIQKCSIADFHVKKVGHITFDFLRSPLKNYYLSKDEIIQKYHLPKNKKLILYISSFAHACMEEQVFLNNGYCINSANKEEDKLNLSKCTQQMTLSFLIKFIENHPDYAVLYRLHPSEFNYDNVNQLAQQYENFIVVKELSIKQWILIADKVFTWQSTAIVEAVYAGKPSFCVGKNDIPDNLRLSMNRNITYIDNYCDFEKICLHPDSGRMLTPETFNAYYGYYDPIKPTYLNLCDALEEVLKESKYNLDPAYFNQLYPIETLKKRINYRLKKTWLYDFYWYLAKHTSWRFKELQRIREPLQHITPMIMEYQKRYHIQENEESQIIRRIAAALEGGQAEGEA